MIFLGIDVGTSATKALAINERGTILAEASHSYQSSHPQPTWSEQNPEKWWNAVVLTIQEVVRRAGIKPADVPAIGLTGQMHGAVFLDKNDKVIRPAILWNDQRTTNECAEIEKAAGSREALVKLVANRAITGFTAPKILWLRNNEPQHFERTAKVLLPKDYVRLRLSGEYATDVSDASGYLLLDVANRRWSSELLRCLDLDMNLLPNCYESVEHTGRLTASAAQLLGLSTDCIVVGGAGDCPAGAIGTGIVTSGTLSTSIGTSSVMMVHSDEFAIDPEGRIHTICHAVPGKWMMMGVNLSGGGCLQWFRQTLCGHVTSESEVDRMYRMLAEEASGVPAGSDGLMFLPYLSGERTPHFDADARGCFIGLTLAHTRGHMVRALMEGVAYNMTHSLQIMRGLSVPVSEIRASGGGSQSDIWRQIQADCFGQTVTSVTADQGPAFGAALIAAVGAGAFATVEEACAAAVHVTKATPQIESNARYYALGLPAFQRLYTALKDEFSLIAALESLHLSNSVAPPAVHR